MGFKAREFRGGSRGRRGGSGKMPTRLIVVLLLAALGWAAKEGYLGPLGDLFRNGGSHEASKGGEYQGELLKLEGARLLSDKGNDGDSFMIKHGGKAYHLRLYYVDAPEKYMEKWNEERVGDQAKYFGIEKRDAVDIGLEAKDAVRKMLSGREFTVYTHWEAVYKSDRYYGFVELGRDGRDGDFLCERLVDAGLARIHTKGVGNPDGVRFYDFRDDLRAREKRAKKARAGAWGR